MDLKDLKGVDIKEKVLFIKTNNPQGVMSESLRKQLYKAGCWGVVCIPKDSEVESLGLDSLERMVNTLKEVHKKKGEDGEQDRDTKEG